MTQFAILDAGLLGVKHYAKFEQRRVESTCIEHFREKSLQLRSIQLALGLCQKLLALLFNWNYLVVQRCSNATGKSTIPVENF